MAEYIKREAAIDAAGISRKSMASLTAPTAGLRWTEGKVDG